MGHLSPPNSRPPPGAFYTRFYDHARRLRFEKLLHLELFRISSRCLKPLLDPGGGFTSESATRRFQK
jgi:hypothetical protein